jgi:hypothetical protein
VVYTDFCAQKKMCKKNFSKVLKMKKIYIISRKIGTKPEIFLFKVNEAYYWSEDLSQATKFSRYEDSDSALQNMPSNVEGMFRIKKWFVRPD